MKKEIASFLGPERKAFIEGYKRSGLYRAYIVEELRKAGLPEELSWLPLIESWFMPQAYSVARALGMWQFIRTTGLRYDLDQDKYIDETPRSLQIHPGGDPLPDRPPRPVRGTGPRPWPATTAAKGPVMNRIKTQKINYLDNFWDLYIKRLPFQTARYVPRLIGAIMIIRDPAKYGLELSRSLIPSSSSRRSRSRTRPSSPPCPPPWGSRRPSSNTSIPELRQKSTPESSL